MLHLNVCVWPYPKFSPKQGHHLNDIKRTKYAKPMHFTHEISRPKMMTKLFVFLLKFHDRIPVLKSRGRSLPIVYVSLSQQGWKIQKFIKCQLIWGIDQWSHKPRNVINPHKLKMLCTLIRRPINSVNRRITYYDLQNTCEIDTSIRFLLKSGSSLFNSSNWFALTNKMRSTSKESTRKALWMGGTFVVVMTKMDSFSKRSVALHSISIGGFFQLDAIRWKLT